MGVKAKDLTGKQFGLLKVIEYMGSSKWLCKCKCGNSVIVRTCHLNSGHTKSCGCLKIGNNTKHNLRHTRLYRIWANMKTRCYNEFNNHYERWGARGITVCDEWKNDFKAFYDWAIQNSYSDDLSIDRIDNDGNYEPSNCRWATAKEQNNNKRNVKNKGVIK